MKEIQELKDGQIVVDRLVKVHGLYTINVLGSRSKTIFGFKGWWEGFTAFDTEEEAVAYAKREFMSPASEAKFVSIRRWEAKFTHAEAKTIRSFSKNQITNEWEEY